MKTVLNKFLKLVNLELRPRQQSVTALMSQPRLASAGKIIEFIGTQGIGKSTLNNDLHRFLKNDWFFRADLAQVGPAETEAGIVEQLHRDIYFRRIQRLKRKEADPWESITTSRQMSRVIGESLTLLTNEFPRGFILDESLFKNFPKEVMKLGAQNPEPLWTNRAFICLQARDLETVVARYRGRVAERRSRGLLQRPPGDDEIRARVTRDNNVFGKIVEQARAFDCPVIVVYAEDDHKENINRILEFERHLRMKD